MAKRVHQIAKELGVKSKALIEKCQAEGIPNITNHMSSVSAGLEATIHEWFGTPEGAPGTAVETADKVDLQKVRAKPRRKTAKKAGKAARRAEPAAPSESERQEPAAPTKTTPSAPTEPAPEKAPGGEEAPDTGKEKAGKKEAELAPAAEAPQKDEEQKSGAAGAPTMNVPKRPDKVGPAGPQLETQKPAKLSGPKVVRVEAPEVVQPRGRKPYRDAPAPMSRARGGGGAGVAVPPPPGEGDSGRRNRRRGGGDDKGPSKSTRSTRRSAKSSGVEKKGTWREQDLIERQARLSRSEGFLRQRRRDQKLKQQRSSVEKAATPAETGGKVEITKPFTIKDLSSATGVRSADIVKKLFMRGIAATPNSSIDDETAMEIMLEYDIDLDIHEERTAEDVVLEEFKERETLDERPRSPVVTILGHVDHGKTSLLDKIRKDNVAEGEAGGITQATSAFRVPVHVGDAEKHVCFLDTPGHEAFTEMRSRGANMTDIVVLVVAADDGVMPQTVESIAHAKAAEVPVIVALNKIDLPNATEENIQKIFGQLAEQGLNPTAWGGDTEVVKTSAATGEGLDDLLETIDLQAELLELKADFKGPASGTVIEARLEEGRGATAAMLVQQGELNVGDNIVAGRAYGRVRDITNDRGERVKSASPSMPVQISGLSEVPDAGDRFYVVKNLRDAQEAAEQRKSQEREKALAQPKVTLDAMFAQMDASEKQELLVVLKADVQGSVDVIKKSIEDISSEDVRVRVLHAAVGGITESDITLASASGAVVLGFNVIPSAKARKMAEQKGVEIRSYRVIYDIVDDIKRAAEGLLEPEIREEVIGHAEVRKVFKVSRVGAVAGCYVTDGTIERNALIRVTRDDIVIEHDRVLEQLKRFKDDAKEVRAGQECGMKIVGYDDIKEGDILECYRKTEVRRTL